MKPEEAKFILRAYRCNKDHSNDVLFADALAEANGDPALLQWLSSEQTFDATMCGHLDRVTPPANLRDDILAGARVSRAKSKTMNFPLWIVAGAIAAAMVVTFTLPPITPKPQLANEAKPVFAAFKPSELAMFAAHNLEHGPHRHVSAAAAINLEQALSRSSEALSSTAGLDFVNLYSSGCQSFAVADRKIVEVCFKRDGNWYHLYVTQCDQTGPAAPVIADNSGISIATWSDDANVYALATRAGRRAIEQVI